MESTELLELYEAGHRDFRCESLRGHNFQGKDLSGADFSGSDIRGANFDSAILVGTNFTRAKAGLQCFWTIRLVVIALLLAGVSGSLSNFFVYLLESRVADFFYARSPEAIQVSEWVALFGPFVLSTVLLTILFTILLRRGIVVFIFMVAVAGTIAFAGVIAGPLTPVFAFLFLFSGAFAFLGAAAVVFVFAFLSSFIVAGRLAAVGAVASGFMFTLFGLGFFPDLLFYYLPWPFGVVFVTVVAVTFMLPSMHRVWCVLSGAKKDAWIRSTVVAWASIGGTSFCGADLTDANFTKAQLKSSDFRRSKLIRTLWKDTEKLDRVRAGDTYLNTSKLRHLLRTGDGKGQSFDHLLNLEGINLQHANLVKSDFTGSNLKDSNLQGANLANADLIGANLNGINLQNADLSGSRLVQAQLDQANLTGVILTGAYIEDWNITTRTQLKGIQCDYIFMRLPPDSAPGSNPHRKPDDWNKNFEDGEFSDFIAPMVETLDLYHNQSVDPRAVAIAFHDLREQHPEAELDLVSVEKRGKRRDKLLLRAESSSQSDRSELHSKYFGLYDHLLTLSPRALQALLIEQDKQVRGLFRMLDTAISRPSQTFISKYHNKGNVTVSEQGSNAPKYNLSNAQFAGGFAEKVERDQIGGTINNYGAQLGDIVLLMSRLREQIKGFPSEHEAEAMDVLDDLEADIKKPKPDSQKIGRRLKRLVSIASTVSVIASGAATFSGNLQDFTNDVAELAETIGIETVRTE